MMTKTQQLKAKHNTNGHNRKEKKQMKKMIKKLLPIILIIAILSISIFPVNAVEKTAEENIVESNIETFFHENSGTLIVSGTGEVRDLYPRETEEAYCDTVVDVDTTVKHLVIDEGITSISNAFNDLHNLQDVLFPETLVKMEGCFNDCDKLKSVDFPSSLDIIGSACFNDCDGIADLYLNAGCEINYKKAKALSFNSLDSLKFLYIPVLVDVNGAFSDCSNLRTVCFADSAYGGIGAHRDDPDDLPCFENCSDDAIIYTWKTSNFNDIAFLPDADASVGKGYISHIDDVLYKFEDVPEVVYLEQLPNEIKINNGINGVDLSWECTGLGNDYQVLCIDNLGGYDIGELQYYGCIKLENCIGSTRIGNFTHATAKSGVEYVYQIETCGRGTDYVSIMYLSRPVLKSVVSSSSKTVTVKWNKVEGAKGYYVYRSATGEAGTWTRIANIKSGDTTSYTATGLKKGSDYYFCVKAYSGTTASASSAKKVVTVGEPVISATTSSNDKITVKWNKISDVKYYRVYMKNKGVPSYTTVATIKDPATVSYSKVWKFDSQNTACVRVRAFYKDGTHQISDPIEVGR